MDYIINSCNRHLNETFRLFYEEELLFKLDDLTTTVKATDARLQQAIDKYNEDHNKLNFICRFRNIQDEDFLKSDIEPFLSFIESDNLIERHTFPEFNLSTPCLLKNHINDVKQCINEFDHIYECSGAVRYFLYTLHKPYLHSYDEEEMTVDKITCKFPQIEKIFNEYEDDRDTWKLLRSFRRIEAEELLANMSNQIYIGRILFPSKQYTF